jgi:hypothetical protein
VVVSRGLDLDLDLDLRLTLSPGIRELTLPVVPAVFLQGTQWHTAYADGASVRTSYMWWNEACMEVLTTATGSPSYS